MYYERLKWLTAAMSIIAMAVALLFVLPGEMKWIDLNKFTIFTAGAALVAAIAAYMSIAQRHHLARERARQHIFIIYAKEDVEAAQNLAHELRDRGYRPWLDVEEVVPGEIWEKSVMRALEESAVALVLVSQHVEQDGFVRKELDAALKVLQQPSENRSPVIPVRLTDTPVPPQLAHVHWVDLFEPDGIEHLERGLASALRRVEEGV